MTFPTKSLHLFFARHQVFFLVGCKVSLDTLCLTMCPGAEVAASGKVKEIRAQQVSTDKEESRIKKIEILQLRSQAL